MAIWFVAEHVAVPTVEGWWRRVRSGGVYITRWIIALFSFQLSPSRTRTSRNNSRPFSKGSPSQKPAQKSFVMAITHHLFQFLDSFPLKLTPFVPFTFISAEVLPSWLYIPQFRSIYSKSLYPLKLVNLANSRWDIPASTTKKRSATSLWRWSPPSAEKVDANSMITAIQHVWVVQLPCITPDFSARLRRTS